MNDYLLQELIGTNRFTLEDDSGYVLLESTVFPKIIRGAVAAREGGATITGRGSDATITEI